MPELLEEHIRATAPAPDEDFLTRLEARVEAGFPKEPRPARGPGGTLTAAPRKRFRLAPLFRQPAASLAACVVIVGATGGVVATSVLVGGSEDNVTMSQLSEPAEEEMSGSDDSSASSGASGSSVSPQAEMAPAPADGDVAPGAERRVVERATDMALTTPKAEFGKTTAGVLDVADRTGTIVASSEVSEDEGSDVATYDLRVPTSRLDETLAGLSKLGDVTSRSSSTDDITAASVSARDRLVDATDRRAALLKALERADTDRERASIERRLRSARREIAQAQSLVARYAARGNRARVQLTVTSKRVEGGAWTPADALDDAGGILQWIASVALVGGAVLLPLALVIAALVGTSRLTRRRRREAALG